MLKFSYRPQVFYGRYRGKGRRDGTLIEWATDVDALVLLDTDLRKQQS